MTCNAPKSCFCSTKVRLGLVWMLSRLLRTIVAVTEAHVEVIGLLLYTESWSSSNPFMGTRVYTSRQIVAMLASVAKLKFLAAKGRLSFPGIFLGEPVDGPGRRLSCGVQQGAYFEHSAVHGRFCWIDAQAVPRSHHTALLSRLCRFWAAGAGERSL